MARDTELIQFFHCKKTEISCMEEPNTFLNQLRDHNLVPDNLYQKVIKMKSKKKRRDGVYEILNWVEKKGGQCVKRFWSCVFQNHILQKYPVLRIHRNSLLDGSFKDYLKRPDEEEPDDTENKSESVQEEEEEGKRKRSVEEEEEEEPGPSTWSTRTRKKASRKPIYTFSQPLKGENAKICTWNLYKTTLPVTCGNKEGTLHRDKLARGIKCILHNGRWFTPNGFEVFAGKGRNKNWKFSIRCRKTPLLKLFQEGHLQCPRMKSRCVRKKILFPVGSSESSSPQSESGVMMEESNKDQEEEREEDEEQAEERHEGAKSIDEEEDDDEPVDLPEFESAVLAVSCDSVTGELYKKRFTDLSTVQQSSQIDPHEFLTHEEVVGFFSKNKTAMSCIENPKIFLNQLRDNKLVQEDHYQEVIKMSNEKTRQSHLYEILEWIEKKGRRFITRFWDSMFQNHIKTNYPLFSTLHKQLLDIQQRNRMDPHRFLTHEEVVDFFSKNKTAISCIENPKIFLNQLRDNKLVQEDHYQEVIKMSNEETRQSRLYEILEWIEKKGSWFITQFWDSMFQNHIKTNYSLFFTLHKQLLDRLKFSAEQLNNEVERQGKNQNQTKNTTERKTGDKETDKAKPSTSFGSSQKRPANKLKYPPMFLRQKLSVTCQQNKGVLFPDKLTKGGKCILSENQWFTPPEFVIFSGKEKSENWKTSIRYRKKTLQKFIKDGRLKCPCRYRN